MKKIILSGLCLSALFADFTLEYNMGEDTHQLVQYKDAKHVKISTFSTSSNNEDENVSQLVVGDKKYLVMNERGKTKYIDIEVMMEKMQGLANQYSGLDLEELVADENEQFLKPKIKIIKKLKNKTVAGIDAEVWTVDFYDEGETERMDVAVTNDKKVVDAIGKYVKVMDSFSKLNPEESSMGSFFNIKKDYVLLSASDMNLVKFDDSLVDANLFILPNSISKKTSKTKTKSVIKKPALCPLSKSLGKAKQLSQMLKPSENDWKLLESGTCLNMMNMTLENAIYQKNNAYIHMSLAINLEDEKGIVATYRNNNLKIKDDKKGKIQGKRYQSAYLEKAQQYAMDIKLQNAILTMSKIGNEKIDFSAFANKTLDLKQFVPVDKKRPNAQDALKELGNMFGGKKGSSMPGDKDIKAAEEMFKGLMGQ
jgi:hypothetical protein